MVGVRISVPGTTVLQYERWSLAEINLDADGGSDGDGVGLEVGMTRTVTYRASLWFDGVSRR